MKLLLGWLTFFVALYLYPAQTLVGLFCILWASIIGATVQLLRADTQMKPKAQILGWTVGIVMSVLLLPFGPRAGVCSDGWASPSIGSQGACSHHGGVDGSGGIYITVVLVASCYAGVWVATKLDGSN
jgi:hypothetical protein